MLTVNDVAKRLNVSRQLVYKLARTGALEHHRIGAALRFSEDQLTRYLDGVRSAAQPEPRQQLRHL